MGAVQEMSQKARMCDKTVSTAGGAQLNRETVAVIDEAGQQLIGANLAA